MSTNTGHDDSMLRSDEHTAIRGGNGRPGTEPKVPPARSSHENRTETSSTQPSREVVSLWRWFGRVAPTVLVIIALAGVGYWGHHTGWKIPKFSELTGHPATDAVAWCGEHGVPEEICIACNADLMPKSQLYGWCQEHGVAECVSARGDSANIDPQLRVES